MKIQIERVHIANAFLPRIGHIKVSEIKELFPNAPFVTVIDMGGVKYNVHRKSVSKLENTCE